MGVAEATVVELERGLVRGLNVLAATISTPVAAPAITATRLRGGSATSSRGAASFAAVSVSTARATGCTGILVVRADSAFYSAAFAGAVRRAGACFSVTAPTNPSVEAAIAAIPEAAWTPIRYPRAIRNAVWLACAAIAHNLLRAAGSLASLACAKARAATLRRDLISVAARTARHGRGEITVHLPRGWHRKAE